MDHSCERLGLLLIKGYVLQIDRGCRQIHDKQRNHNSGNQQASPVLNYPTFLGWETMPPYSQARVPLRTMGPVARLLLITF